MTVDLVSMWAAVLLGCVLAGALGFVLGGSDRQPISTANRPGAPLEGTFVERRAGPIRVMLHP